MEEITIVEGITKKILKNGGGNKPPNGSKVTVHYVAKIKEDGTIFDSTREREQEWQVTLDKDQTIEGLEIGLKTMSEGEKAILTINSKYAFGPAGNNYGFHGRGKPIPPNATLEFEIEVITF